jgi:hypothetical protein
VNGRQYWARALRYYLKISFLNSFVFWAVPLLLALVSAAVNAFAKHRWEISRKALVLAGFFGGFMFLLTLFTAIGNDIYANWGTAEREIVWDPLLVWRVFLYLGCLMFLGAAFMAYHQGLWLSVLFGFFSVASAIAAKRWL